MRELTKRYLPLFLIATMSAVVFLITTLATKAPAVHALPEYSARTSESCSACHVSPGGGGPRTLRGMLWAARGRPDEVPELSGVLMAPDISDGSELFDIACAQCHGPHGEGLFGSSLANSGLSAGKIRAAIERGRLRSGMPAFEGQLTDAQLDALVEFSHAVANGAVEASPSAYPLPAGELTCQSQAAPISCGGN